MIAGVIGIVLPLLPTTPFLLLAAWCFARSSHSFHTWLVTHKYFGKFIFDWEQHRGISRKNKQRACVLIVLSFSFSIYMVPLLWVKLALALGCAGLLFKLSHYTSIQEDDPAS